MKRNHRLQDIIRDGIQDTFHIWKAEMKNVFKDSGVIIFFLVVPVIYPVLYGFIYNNELARNVNMVVVDQSDTYLSRELTRRIDATAEVEIVNICSDMEEAKKMVDSKKAFGILLIPSEFSEDMHRGKQTAVSFYSDISGMLLYKAMLTAISEASTSLGKDFHARLNPGITEKVHDISVNPIPYESVSIFNSQVGFGSFIIPAVLILVIQQTLVLGICMMGGTARERNRFRTLVPVNKHYAGTLRIVFGKSLVYLMIYAIVCLWVLVVVPEIFTFPRIGHPATVLMFILPYLFACIFFSMTLSGLMTSRESPMLVFVFISMILIFISGVSWPKDAVPEAWRIVGNIFPSTHGIQGFVRINTSGALLHDVAKEYRILWIQVGVYFITACLLYRYEIIHTRKLVLKQHATMKRKMLRRAKKN